MGGMMEDMMELGVKLSEVDQRGESYLSYLTLT